MHVYGGTVVVMERFDAEEALALIERYRVTLSQWVPTMFSRLLKLPDDVRNRYDLSSHRLAIHAAAPCPVEVKRRMIEWWGPILGEYYAGQRAERLHLGRLGDVARAPRHGRPAAARHAPHLRRRGQRAAARRGGHHLLRAARRCPSGTTTTRPRPAARSTPSTRTGPASATSATSTSEGFLFLTDRKDFMIISGGVNIYPQEIEDVLDRPPEGGRRRRVRRAQRGDRRGGQGGRAARRRASSSPEHRSTSSSTYCREHLAHYKCPRSIDFTDELPRLPTGKLYKRLLRDQLLGQQEHPHRLEQGPARHEVRPM